MELDEARDWVEESEYIADDGEYRPAFVVDSDTKAAWAMRKYHAALDKMARADELAEIEDKDIFVEWALKNAPELLKVSYAPNMSAVSERCLMAGDGAVEEDTGAVVPGVKVEPGRVSASIKVN